MIKVSDVLSFLEDYAPYNLAESWDNNGLLVGDNDSKITKILCALDVTEEVLNEAIDKNCNLIIAHHPLIFTSVKTVTTSDVTGRIILKAIKNDVSIICMHTNLDCADNGVNDALALKIGLNNIQNLGAGDSLSLGRFGNLDIESQFDDFLDLVKEKLGANGLKYVGNNNVYKVAVLGGSGGKLIDFAVKNFADTYLTADCTYDVFQKAQNLGINLIDAGHFATENVICETIKDKITEKFGNIIEISVKHKDIINFR